MIVGTAGHIDHGKTTLVRALTGVDTDRLREEKARGISIELGYAYTPLGSGGVLGFVDVPGHERLVHTMVAGACGIDFALLVIAADDGMMPQTREHLAILDLLGVRRGAVALTKIDRVDARRVREVRAEVENALASTGLRDAPVFPVNATAGEDQATSSLRRYLHEVAARTPARGDDGLFRLAIDRVFTLTGHGTVVTGTVFSGQIHTDEAVVVMPAGLRVRVRSIHAQNRASDTGRAGERCALNLAGVEKSAVARGDWLADPRALAVTTRVDVRLQLLAGNHAPLKTWSPLHIHMGTAHRVAHLVPLEPHNPSASEPGRVQLVFDSPVCTAAGDRFIARDPQAMHTIGGGVVLDPCAPPRKRRSVERLRYLQALEALIAGEGIAPLLQEASYGVKMSDLVRLTNRAPACISLPADSVLIAAGEEQIVLAAPHMRALRERALAALRDFHTRVPDEPGPDIGRLRRIALPRSSEALWRTLIEDLVREHEVIRSGPWLRLPEHRVTLSQEDQALAQRLQPLVAAGGFDPPWVCELAAAVGEPAERVRQVLRKLVTQGVMHQVVHDLFYHHERIDELAAVVNALATARGSVEAARYRDAVSLGRKRAIQILEYFDRIGYTRRVRDSRVIRADSGWKACAPGGATGLQPQKGASAASW